MFWVKCQHRNWKWNLQVKVNLTGHISAQKLWPSPLTTRAGWGRGGWVTSSLVPSRSYLQFPFGSCPNRCPFLWTNMISAARQSKPGSSQTPQTWSTSSDRRSLWTCSRWSKVWEPSQQPLAWFFGYGAQISSFYNAFLWFFYFSPDFVPTLKSLFGNPVYIIYLCVTILQFNSLIGMVTYKPKYIEQHYGQSASTANFLMGEQSFIYTCRIHDFGFLWTISLFGASEACSGLCCHSLRKLFKDANWCEQVGGNKCFMSQLWWNFYAPSNSMCIYASRDQPL